MPEDATDLDATSGRDLSIAGGLAALNLVPVVGGTIATLISELVPREKQQRLVRFVEDLGERVKAEQERIDAEFVRTDEFATLFEDTLDRVQQRRQQEKTEYWARLVVGVAGKERPPRADRERFVDTLERLRISHLRLLHVIATTTTGKPDLYMGGINSTLEWTIPDTPFEDLRRDWDDLAREVLVNAYPSGMMTAAGAGNLAAHITPYGRQFVRLLGLEDTLN